MPLLRRTPAPRPDDVIEVAGHPVRLRVSPRARRVGLKVDPVRREVVASAPSLRRLGEAAAFARDRSAWIADRLTALPASAPFAPGAQILVGGEPCVLERAAMRIPARFVAATDQEPMRLIAYGDGEAYARAVGRALKAEALTRLKGRTARHADALGVAVPEVAVMDAKGRWGSCTPPMTGGAGKVRYSWRLILAPPSVLDYVAAHEAAHLVHPDHSPRFWAAVTRVYGDWKPAREWLRRRGAELHAAGR